MLVVEDSRVTRTYIKRVLSEVPEFEVLEPAVDGRDAVAKALAMEPDIILMDLHLPELDGVMAIELIMSQKPCPIVVLSGELTRRDTDYTFAALNAGAVDVISKPKGMATELREDFTRQLVDALRLMSKVKVVTRRFPRSSTMREISEVITQDETPHARQIELVAIGASTGGPAALYELLTSLPTPAPFAVIISQHIANGFEHGLCSWLRTTGHDVEIPLPGTPVLAGKVYLSPANASVTVGPKYLEIVPTVGGEITPNIDRLFSSVARYYAKCSLGILLTGMGSDGVRGLGQLRNAGAWTIAQNPATAVISSMPGGAVDSGAAGEVLDVADIGKRLAEIADRIGGRL